MINPYHILSDVIAKMEMWVRRCRSPREAEQRHRPTQLGLISSWVVLERQVAAYIGLIMEVSMNTERSKHLYNRNQHGRYPVSEEPPGRP